MDGHRSSKQRGHGVWVAMIRLGVRLDTVLFVPLDGRSNVIVDVGEWFGVGGGI